MTAKLKEMKCSKQLIGQQLPTNENGCAGIALENLLENIGFEINRGAGPDLLEYGAEIKTRKISATSPQTIATMSALDIIHTPYKQSAIYEKFKQQFRVYTNDFDQIQKAEVFDFDKDWIQDNIEAAYEYSRAQIVINQNIKCCKSAGQWGYFEQCHLPKSKNYSFRLNNRTMIKVEGMAKSTFGDFFEVGK